MMWSDPEAFQMRGEYRPEVPATSSARRSLMSSTT